MNRIEKLQKHLDFWKVDALLIENPVDLFYLTGFSLSKGRLVIEKMRAHLYVDSRYFAMVSATSSWPVSLLEKGSGLEAKRIGFDSAYLTVAALDALQKEASHTNFSPIKKPLRQERMIKEPEEIEHLRKAAHLTMRGIRHIQDNFLIEGISEEEVAFEFEYFVRKHGASGLSFESIIAFGENSAYPHYRAGSCRLKKNQAVLVDVGAIVNKYSGDATRVLFFGISPEIQEMYRLVQDAYVAAKEAAIIGATFGSIDRKARDVFAKAGVEGLFVHSLGHGVGLETHESPIIRWNGDDKDLPMQKGMVFTIEPGLYQPGIGGARYEDTGVLQEIGFEALYL